MRFIMFVKADSSTEAGALPSREDLEVMGRYNDELIKAGVLLHAEGLQPSSKGAKVAFRNGKPQVTDGPFAGAGDLVAGFWIIEVNSKDEAIEWAKRVPFDRLPTRRAGGPEIEVRQVFEMSDFPDVPAEVEEMETAFRGAR